MLFEHFDRIQVINLAHRADRRREMTHQLKKAGIEQRSSFFPAVAPSERGLFAGPGYRGSFMSHLGVLRGAAAAGESVLILEDDCDFVFPDVLEYDLPPATDVFYGGYLEASDPADPARSDIVGAHFMGFSARAAKLAAEYLAGMLDPDCAPDPRAAAEPGYDHTIRPPIDGGYVWFRRAYPELTTVFAMLSDQRPSRTDCGQQKWFDRAPVIRNLAGLAREARRMLA